MFVSIRANFLEDEQLLKEDYGNKVALRVLNEKSISAFVQVHPQEQHRSRRVPRLHY